MPQMFVKKLRDAAMRCSNLEYRELLRAAADQIEEATELFYAEQTEMRLRVLNGTWAVAERIYKNLPSEGDPAPLSGSPEPARLAA